MAASPPPGFNIYFVVIIGIFLLILVVAALLIYSWQCSAGESLWRCLRCGTSGGREASMEAVSIPVCRYREEQSFSSECSVCLTEFREGEKVRQLPSCRHSFHAPCVDMWLCSHPSCPSCRAPVPQVPCPRIEPMADGDDSRQRQLQNSETAVDISSVVM